MKASKKLIIEVEGEEIAALQSGLKKIIADLKKVGLNNSSITAEEIEAINNLNDSLK